MRSRSIFTAVAFAAASLAAFAPLSAHHSFAMFDMQKTVELKGTVVEFRWSNPHSSLDLDVPNKTGTVDRWSIEMTSPNNLVRVGWKRTILKPGDKATIIVHPLRDGNNGGSIVGAVLADGTKLTGS